MDDDGGSQNSVVRAVSRQHAGLNSRVRLRAASVGDIGYFLPMMADFNATEEIVVDPPHLEQALLELLGDAQLGRAWLVEFDQEIVGYAVLTFGYDLEFAGRDAFLTELFVRRRARRQGVASAVLRSISAEAANLGVHAIHLMVRPENGAAVALYRKAGYLSQPRMMLSKLLPSEAKT